ncbi:hypothetical protein KC19_7G018800 [Ceratodon purpureus]|uniref:Endonuclease/exonuclease/phosphatase domain-containing protein n=1 Tax=Ceratodon purpureus TaxID=3225 RepID=A0A8T0H9U0_CERPU|nr:hypothetical protein KC19_7G018800 [Ceratodon purpureus]
MAEDDHCRSWLGTHANEHHELFLIMSYNILADANARTHSKDLSEHIPALITDWEARKASLLQELQLYLPDVICLQEVDQFRDFEAELQKVGYSGVYKKRTGAEERFELLEEENIEFKDYQLRDNVGQVCALGSKYGSRENRVVIGNVHVMFNPLRGEVKLGQARVLLEKVHSMSGKWGDVPVVIAGDFNSTPWSPMYQFLSSSYLDLVGLNRRCISGQEDDGECESKRSKNKASQCLRKSAGVSRKRNSVPNKVKGWDPFELLAATGNRNLSVVQHKLKLRSVYSEIEGKPSSRDARGEPFVTTFHRMFKGTVDYIWHNEGLCAVRVLDTPPTSVLVRDKGMPSKRWRSDHLALACELSFVPKKDT